MTRETLPRFDLYGELEVSRLASVATIEAAYRSLVKRHHPDVAHSMDEDRMVRLNLAREWLSEHGAATPWRPELRFDAVGVELDQKGHLLRIDHLEGAF